MSEEQERVALDAVTKHPALSNTLALSGLRIGEALALQPDDVSAAELHVRRTLAHRKTGHPWRIGSAHRRVAGAFRLDRRAHLAALLRAHIAAGRERHFKAGHVFEWLFSTSGEAAR